MIKKTLLVKDKWVKISDAGETGSVWAREMQRGVTVYITHSESFGTTELNIGDIDIELSTTLDFDSQPNLLLVPDSPTDVFYATYIDNDGDEFDDSPTVITDMVMGA